MQDVTFDTHVAAVTPAARREGAEAPRAAGPGADFAKVLMSAVAEVNAAQGDADRKVTALVSGTSGDVHGTMLALERADISFRLMMQVRNRLLDAYTEVMRMQI
jgi:flagellar hook-basal body complex protein FliE